MANMFEKAQIDEIHGSHFTAIGGDQNTTVNNIQPAKSSKDMLMKMLNPDLKAHINRDKACLKGTREKIIQKIMDWIHEPDAAKAFFIHGPAGTGKSAIGHSVGQLCKEENCLGAFFHFDRTFAMERNPAKAICTIAFSLALYIPEFKDSLQRLLDKDPFILDSPSLDDQWLNLIHMPAQKVGSSRLVVIVVDALDESGPQVSDGERETFISILLKGIQELPGKFRVLVTSRPEKDITAIYAKYSYSQMMVQNMSTLEHTRDDIDAYVVYKMQKFIDEGSLDHSHCKTIGEKSEGHFQWASTLCKALHQENKPGINIWKRYENFIASTEGDHNGDINILDQLYHAVLSEVLKVENVDAMRKYKNTMGQILAAFEPLSKHAIQGLQKASGHQEGELPDDDQGVDVVISWLGSLFTGVNDSNTPIRPMHTSIRDFLLDENRSNIFYVDLTDGHMIMATGTLKLMSKELHFNMCNLKSSYLFNHQMINVKDMEALETKEGLMYACLFWSYHLVGAEYGIKVLNSVKEFMLRAVIFWVEVLGIRSKVDVVSQSMDNTLQWLGSSRVSMRFLDKVPGLHVIQNAGTATRILETIAWEIKKFGHIFGRIITESTPHLYISGITFLPTTSLLQELFLKQFASPANFVQGHQAIWPALEVSLSGHKNGVTSVAFSPDGTRIVSGSGDKSVRIWNAENGTAVGTPFQGHTHWVSSVAFSPDGTRIVSGSWDNTVRIWNGEDGTAVGKPLQGHTESVCSVAFSPDGTRIVSGSGDTTVRIWNADSGTAVGKPLQGHTDWVRSVAFSPDGTRIVSGSDDNSVRIWNADSGTAVGKPLQGHTDGVFSVAFSPDGTRIVSGSDDNSVRIWNADGGTAVWKPLQRYMARVRSMAFSPDGTRIVSVSDDNSVRIWNADSGTAVGKPLQGHTNWVRSVAFSPDGTRIVSGSGDTTVRIWNAHIGTAVGKPLQGHTNLVSSVAFSPDGTRIVSGSQDKSVRIWNADSGTAVGKPLQSHTDEVTSTANHMILHPLTSTPSAISKYFPGSGDNSVRIWNADSGTAVEKPLQGHTSLVFSVAFSPDGTRIVSGSWDTTVRIWNADSGTAVGEPLQGHTDWVRSVAFSPDGTRIVSGSDDNSVRIWNAASGTAVGKPLQEHTESVCSVAFSPDGTRIVSGSGDTTVRIWNADSGTAVEKPFQGHTGWVCSVAFSPDGTRIVSGSDDNTVRIWNADSGTAVGKPLQGHTQSVCSVAFSPDGTRIVSGSGDTTVRIWNADSGTAVGKPLQGHTDWVRSVSFSPDGTRIVSGSDDMSVRIWNADSGTAVGKPLQGHTSSISSVAFSPDGTRIVSGSGDTSVRIWNADSGTAAGKPSQRHMDEVTSTASHIILHPLKSTLFAISKYFPMLELQQNGWLVDPNNESLILWIPPEYRSVLSIPPLAWVISQEYDPAILDWGTFTAHGPNWTSCYTQPSASIITDAESEFETAFTLPPMPPTKKPHFRQLIQKLSKPITKFRTNYR
ncbi:hypothetical protein D9757_012674 [Collybiopsis confluens]|uniref:Nephrocystin 3-like N-terminal domain-containing protein n=1 Tax=Collybiopsis confluens TaxID=2823264 RepID=A0A8H5LQK3_9AGAR|nr:hypothetical protein D9757_012674 [Collybiopsis confluens]